MSGRLKYYRRLIAVVGDVRTDEAVIEWARALTTDLHLPLTLLSVSDPVDAQATVSTLTLMVNDLRLSRLTVEPRAEIGKIEQVLPKVAHEEAGTIVLLPQPPDARQAAEITDWSIFPLLVSLTTPFIVIPEGAAAPTHIHSVVVGNDQSDLAETVLIAARSIGRSLGVDVIEVEAHEPSETSGGAETVISPRLIRATGLASRVLLRSARARDAALIVVGSHGLGRGDKPLAGRTTEWLLAHSDRPVVVVPRG